jgi:uncharacterized membrane protein
VKNDKIYSCSIIKISIPLLGLAGMGISGYLTCIHYKNIAPVCLFDTHCNTVLTSQYAQIFGFPLALFGLLTYILLAVTGFLNLFNSANRQRLTALGIYAMALSGALFTLYLYYLEIFKIHAFCNWCIASSIVIFGLLGLSIANLKSTIFKYKK